jgi:hypothetical protein
VTFDDDLAVAGAGLSLVGILSEKLGLVELVQELVDVCPFPGKRVATLVHAMVARADCIDDADVLRSGATAAALGHKVAYDWCLGSACRGPGTRPALVRTWRSFRSLGLLIAVEADEGTVEQHLLCFASAAKAFTLWWRCSVACLIGMSS